ncbi:hypothetical protein Goklo_029174 [Gossypium klotzschianum]|uniref:DUF4283 domain-containing protein n=1 Tax=Gossypium klotzschianum TaxID=34286 RepID=A0A7J8WA01_9ROSI|nr:hypothetical protein [Gossypium klotzschianum]
MEVVLVPDRPRSWKDRLIGTGLRIDDKIETSTKKEDDDNLDLPDEDIVRSLVNGILAIDFSNRVNQLLIKDMEHTVIRLPRLPGHMYKRKILWEIRGMIERVAKLDFNIDNGVRGKFARMAIYFNLRKALISQVLINGVLQRIEYKYLPTGKTISQLAPTPMVHGCSLKNEIGDGQKRGRPLMAQPETRYKKIYKGESVTNATEVKEHGVTQGRQIVGETHGTQPAEKLEPHPSHRFNAESLLEEEYLTHKNAMGRRKNTFTVSTSGGRLNGNTKGQKLKRTIRDKGSPFKVTSLKVPLVESITNMVELSPDIVSLLEPNVSGSNADEIIAKLGFHRSHRIEAREDIQEEAVNYFQKLYGEKPSRLEKLPLSHFPPLENSDIDFLQKEVTNEEIKTTLFDMAPLKAPGSDGYHAFFFQNQWDNIGGAVCAWVKDVFNGRPIGQELNNTLIVLIPKIAQPEEISQFGSISLL